MYLKWIFAFIGLSYLGLRGALAGFVIGAILDALSKKPKKEEIQNGLNPFTRSLVIITAAVMKADGKVLKDELEYVKTFFRQQFNDEITKQALLYLRDALKKTLPLEQACIQVRRQLDYATRIHVLHYLFGLARSEGNITLSEENAIEHIASHLGILHADFLSIKSAYIRTSHPNDTHWAYKILEIQPNASNDEVKKAYRRMAIKHHPDKVIQQSEKQRKEAEEHFKKINDAFEHIKRQRSMN